MSYQPSPSFDPAAALPSMAAPQAPARRRSWLGPLLIVAGLLGAVATYLAQQVNHRNRVENLERAVSGYTTTLTFEKAGTFTIYYEYAGSFRTTFDGQEEQISIESGETPPDFTATLTDAEAAAVSLDTTVPATSYDANGFKGRAYAEVVIDQPGDYTLQVVPDNPSDEFALAIGIGRVTKPSIALPLVVALVGVVPGLLVLLLGRRRDSPQVASSTAIGGPPTYHPGQVPAPPAGYAAAPPPPMAPPMGSPPPVPGQPPLSGRPTPPAPTPAPTEPARTPPVPTGPAPLPPPTWGPPSA